MTRVEQKLNDIFKLAKRWNAIVLVDEADVILAKRSTEELERNSVVAGKNFSLSPYTVYDLERRELLMSSDAA